ncbi:MAG: protein-L-isoaspartate(D-aspartate) O-methyltransferase [Bacteroidota bacterium]|nr:protein-L-isoaspartate(D-aspartate) O-methyltransferase [Candidatus Kapabacteria bacterium]MDW8220540.1 protein-L-isoaspartate(D-aspartate) O-methyltransferase [Bacteroidota bacterium]
MIDHVQYFQRYSMQEAQKRALLEELYKKGIRNESVLRAIAAVPREKFLPHALQHRAYDNVSLPIGSSQTISQPYTVAFMTELLALSPEEYATTKILEVGTGSGYQTAILAYMGVRRIYTIERIPGLLEEAKKRFKELGIQQIHTQLADGTLGWEEEAPFDAIIVTAGSPDVPQALALQLALGGRLVIPIGSRMQQRLYRVRRIREGTDPGAFRAEEFQHFRFVPLVGEQGWQEE